MQNRKTKAEAQKRAISVSCTGHVCMAVAARLTVIHGTYLACIRSCTHLVLRVILSALIRDFQGVVTPISYVLAIGGSPKNL